MIWFLLIPLGWYITMAQYQKIPSPTFGTMGSWGFFEWVTTIVMGLLISALAAMLIGLFAGTIMYSWFCSMSIWNYREISRAELVSIKEKEGVSGSISGSMFMFGGSFDSRPYYFYYVASEGGAISPEKVQADKTVFIHEGDGVKPVLITLQHFPPWWCKIFALMDEGTIQHHFYIPAGSVKKGFAL